MALAFNQIGDPKIPLFYAEVSTANANTATQQFRTLIVGAGETADTELHAIPSYAAAVERYGAGSEIAWLAEHFFANNLYGTLVAFQLGRGNAVSGGTARVTPTFSSGTETTAAGTITIDFIGERVVANIASGSDITDIIAAITAAINANAKIARYFTASSEATYTLLTPRDSDYYWHEALANFIDTATNIGNVALASSSQNSNAGALAGDYSAVTEGEWDILACNSALGSHMDTGAMLATRWDANNGRYGVYINVRQDTVTNLVAHGNSVSYPHECIVGMAQGAKVSEGAMAALIAGSVSRSAAIDPARPFQTLSVSNSSVQAGEKHTTQEQESLLSAGISTLSFNVNGGLNIQRLVTTYSENSLGLPDNAFFDVNTSFTLAYVLRQLAIVLTTKFPRHKLANNGASLRAGSALVTPSIIKSEIIAAYRAMEVAGIVENTQTFAEGLSVERNATNPNRVDVLLPADLVNQLRIIAVLANFRR